LVGWTFFSIFKSASENSIESNHYMASPSVTVGILDTSIVGIEPIEPFERFERGMVIPFQPPVCQVPTPYSFKRLSSLRRRPSHNAQPWQATSLEGLTSLQLTRRQALKRVVKWSRHPNRLASTDRKLNGLISLFGLDAEELLEAGMSFEVVKGLQRHWLI
jgi:hypothetical protein